MGTEEMTKMNKEYEEMESGKKKENANIVLLNEKISQLRADYQKKIDMLQKQLIEQTVNQKSRKEQLDHTKQNLIERDAQLKKKIIEFEENQIKLDQIKQENKKKNKKSRAI